MSKYEPLRSYLASQAGDTCQLTHKRIEQIIGTALPGSARDYRQWWANETSGNRPQAVWMDAGWRVDDCCEPQNGRVRFVRRGPA